MHCRLGSPRTLPSLIKRGDEDAVKTATSLHEHLRDDRTPLRSNHLGYSDASAPCSLAGSEETLAPDPITLRGFVERSAARRRGSLLRSAVSEWRRVTSRFREIRRQVGVRFERASASHLHVARRFLLALKARRAQTLHSRRVSETLFETRRHGTLRTTFSALSANLHRAHTRELAAEAFRVTLDVRSVRRRRREAFSALRRACLVARDIRVRADQMRDEGVNRLTVRAFGAWATAAGLAGRLRKRLGRADRALLAKAMSAWTLLRRHAAERRLRREKRTEDRGKRLREKIDNLRLLCDVFAGWVNLTAASKFRRLCLLTRALQGWGGVARASAAKLATNQEPRE